VPRSAVVTNHDRVRAWVSVATAVMIVALHVAAVTASALSIVP
jgi:hypothetical protein